MDLQLQIAHAVRVLNHDLQSCNRVAANQWLVQFQHSHAAWEVAAGLLVSSSLQASNFEVELFAAQVLKRKIQNEAESLTPEACTALQNALLKSARNFSSGPAQLLTQVCLALSALVLRALDWRTPIDQLFTSLSELEAEGTESNAAVELLTVLPEEVSEDQAGNSAFSQHRRWHFLQELLSHTVPVLDFLLRHVNHAALEGPALYETHQKILRCILSWVRAGCLLEVPQDVLPTHPLFGFVFSSLQVPSTFQLGVEVLKEAVARHQDLPQALLRKIILLKETLLGPAIAAGDEQVLAGLTALMAELGQAAPALVAQASSDALALVDALLRCAGFPSAGWEVVESTLQFWCTLAQYLLEIEGPHWGHWKQSVAANFVPVFQSLLSTLVMRAEVGLASYREDDTDGYSGLPDGLAQFRKNLEEPFLDICRVLTPARCISELLEGVETWSSPAARMSGQAIEARLFALHMLLLVSMGSSLGYTLVGMKEAVFQQVAEVVTQDERLVDQSPIIHLFMLMPSGLLHKTDCMLHLLHKSAAHVIGCYSSWICRFPLLLSPLISFLAAGLTIPLAAGACATALRRVCEDAFSVSPNEAMCQGLLCIGEDLHNIQLSLQEEEDVMCAVGRILTRLTETVELNQALERLLGPSYDSIGALLETCSEGFVKVHSAAYAAQLAACIRGLRRLGITFSQLHGTAPSFITEEAIIRVCAHFWPVLENLFGSRHMEDGDLASAACKALSQAMRIAGHQFSPLLPSVMSVLSAKFLLFPSNVCFMKTACVVVEEFGGMKEFGPLFVETLSMFTASESVSGMSTSYACDQEPDLAEAYMTFTSTFLRACPQEVVAVADLLLESSINRATICCTAMHRGAALAAMSFMSNFLDLGVSSLCRSCYSFDVIADRIVLRCGENIISGVLCALLGASGMTRVHKSTSILQLLSAFCYLSGVSACKSGLHCATLQDWLSAAMHGLPPEYLGLQEKGSVMTTWFTAMEAAALDYYQWWIRKGSDTCIYIPGDGGRYLKRVIRDFAETNRHAGARRGLL